MEILLASTVKKLKVEQGTFPKESTELGVAFVDVS